MSKKGREERHMKELRDAFDAADKDKDGKLSPQEWLQVLKITGVDANWWVMGLKCYIFGAFLQKCRLYSPNPTTNSKLTNSNFHEFFDLLEQVL